MSGLADIRVLDFTESDSTGLDWFVRGLGLVLQRLSGLRASETDIPDFADVTVTDSTGLDWRPDSSLLGPALPAVRGPLGVRPPRRVRRRWAWPYFAPAFEWPR